jgi:hypothetical protein
MGVCPGWAGEAGVNGCVDRDLRVRRFKAGAMGWGRALFMSPAMRHFNGYLPASPTLS